MMDNKPAHIGELLDVMRRLRDPQGGCPWDLEQNFRSIVPHTLEEAYEVADAIEQGDMDELPGELGDLLFQIVFYAQLGNEEGRFDFNDVVAGIVSKLIRRHPHVFADEQVADTQAQTVAWEKLKAAERDAKSANHAAGVLAGVSKALPALTRAGKLQRRAAKVGFDWPDQEGVWANLKEEITVFEQTLASPDGKSIEAEMGDVLFAWVAMARHLGIDPESALRGANGRFQNRFETVEAELEINGGEFSERFDVSSGVKYK